MQYRIVITSSKGGVGKSTTAAMLAQALAERGKRVLLLDLDLGNRCLDMFFGIENEIVCDFGVVYDDPGTACRAVRKLDVGAPGVLSFCASSTSLIPSEVIEDKLVRTVDLLGDIAGADYVICDTAGTVIPEKLAKWANLGLLCSSQMPASVRSAATTAGRLREAGLGELRLIVTSFEYKEAKDRTRAGLLEMIDNSGIRAVGVVPLDRRMFLMQEEGRLPDAKSPARRAYANIAARLCGEERKLFDGIRRMNGKSVL